MKLQNLIENLRLSAPAKAELDSILRLPEVKSILGREESAAIEERRSLIAALAKIPAQYEAEHKEAGARMLTATKKLEAAEDALRLARESFVTAAQQSYGHQHSAEHAVAEIRLKLWASRDARLIEYRIALSPVENACRNDWKFWSEQAPRDWFTGGHKRVVLKSNCETLASVSTALREVIEDLEFISYAALTRDEISARLTVHSKNLLRVINASSINDCPLPFLDSRGEVRAMTAVEAEFIGRGEA